MRTIECTCSKCGQIASIPYVMDESLTVYIKDSIFYASISGFMVYVDVEMNEQLYICPACSGNGIIENADETFTTRLK